jgi:hypothetical protein
MILVGVEHGPSGRGLTPSEEVEMNRRSDEAMSEVMGSTPAGRVFLKTLELVRLKTEDEAALQELRPVVDEDRASVERAQQRLVGVLEERFGDPEGERALELLSRALDETA